MSPASWIGIFVGILVGIFTPIIAAFTACACRKKREKM